MKETFDPDYLEGYLQAFIQIGKKFVQETHDISSGEYLAFFDDAAVKIKSMYSRDSEIVFEDQCTFFAIFLKIMFNIMVDKCMENGEKNYNRALYNLLCSGLNKYEIIVNLMETEHESALILFRSFYENMVILCFLIKNSQCMEAFEKYSFYKLEKLAGKAFDKALEEEHYTGLAAEKDNLDIKNDYGWANAVIENEKIRLVDLIENIFENNKDLKDKMSEMFYIVSDLVHSNTGVINDSVFSAVLKTRLKDWLHIFSFSMLKDNFFGSFNIISNGKLKSEIEILNILTDILLSS